jgi:hypothetical protein
MTRSWDAFGSFFGADPQTVAGMGANVAGGMLIVGDIGSLVKNGWRGFGFSGKEVNYAEVTLSALGIATEIAVGAGEAADLPISQVRAIVAAFGNTKFTKVLVILLKRALTNAQDMVRFGRLVGKMFTSEAAMQIAQKIFTSEQALKEGIDAFERFGDNFFPSLKSAMELFSDVAARRLSFVLGNLNTATANAFKQLSPANFKAATDSMGAMFFQKRVAPEDLLKLLNNLPNQFLTAPTKLVTLLSDMAAVVKVKGFNDALQRIVDIIDSTADATKKAQWIYGRLYEFRVAAWLKAQGKSVNFIDEFVQAAEGLGKTDIDVVADGVYYQAKSSAGAFGTGQKALDAVEEWVKKARKHAELNGIDPPVIKYVVPNLDMVPENVKAFLAKEGYEIIPLSF